MFITLNEEISVILSVVSMCILLVVGFIYYLFFHKHMKRFKIEHVDKEEKKQVVVVQTTFYSEKKTHSNAWFIIPFVLIVLTIIFTHVNYNLFPNQIPTNFNLSGKATNWMEKSRATVLFIPLTQLYMLVIFMFVNIVIRTAKQQTNPNNPKESLQKNVIFRRRWSGFLMISATLLIAMFSFLQYTLVHPVSVAVQSSVYIGLTVFILLGCIYLSFTLGQGGSRIRMGTSSNNEDIDGVGDDDRFWKLGLFYVNKNDPSLFIEKRFGIGWSVNLARPLVWLLFGLMFGFIIVLIVFLP